MKKKNIILLLLMAMLLTIGGQAEAQAQGRKADKEYWKRIEKAEKERAKYIRKLNKSQDKYYKEVRKQEEKFYKESAKRERKYYKDLRKIYKNGPPVWAKAYGYDSRHHIYFSDYRTFYDPYRGGYVNPVNRHPEDFYYDYDNGYWD